MKTPRLIQKTKSAYEYPLLIKQMLHTPILYAPDQEIVYRDLYRYSYREFYRRIARLANALEGLDIGPGDTVAVLGLGFSPVPGMLLRSANDGSDPP